MARQPMTIEQILAVLRETPERLSVLAGGLTEPRLRAAPEPGEWSVTEIVAHLRSCADVWGGAIELIATTSLRRVAGGVQGATRATPCPAGRTAGAWLVARRHRARGRQATGTHRALLCGPPGPSRADALETGGEDGAGPGGLKGSAGCT